MKYIVLQFAFTGKGDIINVYNIYNQLGFVFKFEVLSKNFFNERRTYEVSVLTLGYYGVKLFFCSTAYFYTEQRSFCSNRICRFIYLL